MARLCGLYALVMGRIRKALLFLWRIVIAFRWRLILAVAVFLDWRETVPETDRFRRPRSMLSRRGIGADARHCRRARSCCDFDGSRERMHIVAARACMTLAATADAVAYFPRAAFARRAGGMLSAPPARRAFIDYAHWRRRLARFGCSSPPKARKRRFRYQPLVAPVAFGNRASRQRAAGGAVAECNGERANGCGYSPHCFAQAANERRSARNNAANNRRAVKPPAFIARARHSARSRWRAMRDERASERRGEVGMKQRGMKRSSS